MYCQCWKNVASYFLKKRHHVKKLKKEKEIETESAQIKDSVLKTQTENAIQIENVKQTENETVLKIQTENEIVMKTQTENVKQTEILKIQTENVIQIKNVKQIENSVALPPENMYSDIESDWDII